MNLSWHRVVLPLARPFSISRGTRTQQSSLYVELEHDGVTGFGEVAENSFYGHTLDSIIESLEKSRPYLSLYANNDPADVWNDLSQVMDGDMFALSALDIAAHDLKGKQKGLPTWQDWGLEWDTVCPSSFTIGIDSIPNMVEKMEEKSGWAAFKIKLGTDHDLEIVQALRHASDATFRVDANCGWTVEQVVEYSKVLADLGVEFIEQPLSVDATDAEKLEAFEKSSLPIIADENCQIRSDVEQCAGYFHGINIKIAKCGGLSPALEMVKLGKQLDLKVMVGCMIESSVGISGAAQLLPLLDFADLDGAVLLRDEPAKGVQLENGRVVRPTLAGCGAKIDFDRMGQFQVE